jgi:hypothetical protein
VRKELDPEGKPWTWLWSEINPREKKRRKPSKVCETSRAEELRNWEISAMMHLLETAKREKNPKKGIPSRKAREVRNGAL